MRPALLLILLPLAACARKPDAPAPPPPPPPAPAPAPAPAPTVRLNREFKPSLHGFKFVNAFRGSPLPSSLRGLERILGSAIPDRFGLCGGMASAAADFFLAGLQIPDAAKPPVEGEPLYTYIYDRQTDSFGAGYAVPLRIMQGMATPDAGPQGLAARNAAELPSIRERLAAGELLTLCLILGKADGKTKPWDNHQVLAYGDATTNPDAPTLRIYDPNFPGDDEAVLAFAPGPGGLLCTRLAHRRGALSTTPVRGVFPGPYSKRTPTLAD